MAALKCDGPGLVIKRASCEAAVGNGDGVDVDEARRLRLDGGEAILDGGHSGDAREVDERRSGPHQREREGATQGELVSVTRKEGNIDNTSRD